MDPERLLAALDATWAPAETAERGDWVLRRGAGGGKRVSAASARVPGAAPDLSAAVEAMAAWGQRPLFRLAPGEADLDRALAAAGYELVDPVAIYTAPVAALTDGADETAKVIRVQTRIALADEIWAAGGIGPERLAVMARSCTPRITLLARIGDRPVGVGFVAADGDVAMLHAVEVLAGARRQGAGTRLLRGAASWAEEAGAGVLALAVTEANRPARALYERLGMEVAARYHYRQG